jgi:hypothetical protein
MAGTIPVVVEPIEKAAVQTLGLRDHLEKFIADIDADTLRQSLTSLSTQLRTLFQDVKKVGDFKLSQIQVGIQISAEGGVALIGTAKAGASGTINLTFSPE